MLQDTRIKELAEYLRDELNRLGDAEYDAISQPRQTVVAKAVPYRPDLITEQFPLLACYRTSRAPNGVWSAELRWQMQATTKVMEIQQDLLYWVAAQLPDLLPLFEGQNDCLHSITVGTIELGFVALQGQQGQYPAVECQFTFTDTHA